MSARWKKLQARLRSMTLRERVLLFACAVVILGAITEEVFIAPLTKLQTQYAQDLEKRSATMEAQRERVEKELVIHRRERVSALESDLAEVQGRIQAVDAEIRSLDGAMGDIAALRGVLSRALRHSDKVTLVRVSTAESAAPAPAGAPSAAPTGVEIVLAGTYPDLMDYFATLQAQLPHARWSALHINAQTVPTQATVRIVATRGAP